jgi:hypothetical protein
MTDTSWLIEHVVESAKSNPRMARGLRDLIKNAIEKQTPGSDEHSHLLETINSLDNYIASDGNGYAKERVAEAAK